MGTSKPTWLVYVRMQRFLDLGHLSVLWYVYVCALCAGQWIGEGTKGRLQILGQSFVPTPYPWGENRSQMDLSGRATGPRASGKASHEIQREVLCAVPASGFGNMGFLLEPWFMDHCSKNLTLPSLWDGHVVHIAISYFYEIMAPIKGSGGLGSGDAHF